MLRGTEVARGHPLVPRGHLGGPRERDVPAEDLFRQRHAAARPLDGALLRLRGDERPAAHVAGRTEAHRGERSGRGGAGVGAVREERPHPRAHHLPGEPRNDAPRKGAQAFGASGLGAADPAHPPRHLTGCNDRSAHPRTQSVLALAPGALCNFRILQKAPVSQSFRGAALAQSS